MGVEPKIGVDFTPKMDGEQMDDLGGFPIFFGNTHVWTGISTPTFKGLTEIYGINLWQHLKTHVDGFGSSSQ